VKSVAESVGLAKQLGGKLLVEPKAELAGLAKWRWSADPTGAGNWYHGMAAGPA
jgi:hypothetical protein